MYASPYVRLSSARLFCRSPPAIMTSASINLLHAITELAISSVRGVFENEAATLNRVILFAVAALMIYVVRGWSSAIVTVLSNLAWLIDLVGEVAGCTLSFAALLTLAALGITYVDEVYKPCSAISHVGATTTPTATAAPGQTGSLENLCVRAMDAAQRFLGDTRLVIWSAIALALATVLTMRIQSRFTMKRD